MIKTINGRVYSRVHIQGEELWQEVSTGLYFKLKNLVKKNIIKTKQTNIYDFVKRHPINKLL